MNISRKKFVALFILFGFVFMFVSTSLLGSTGVRGFPQSPDTLLETASPVAWKQTASTLIKPIKIGLLAPLLLSDNFLQDDPPPPFVGIFLLLYWTVLASVIYPFLSKSYFK